MSSGSDTRATWVAGTATAAAILGLGLVVAATAGQPLWARALAGTVIGVGGVTAWVSRSTGMRGRFGRPSRAWWRAIGTGTGLAVFGTGALALERALVPAWGPRFAVLEARYLELLRPDETSWIPIVLVVAVLAPGLVEEWLFRGVLRDVLASLGRGRRVLFLGVAFSVFHAEPLVLVPMVYVGAMLTLVAEAGDGWGAAAVAHLSLNLVNAVVWPRLAGDVTPDIFGGLAMLAIGVAVAHASLHNWLHGGPATAPEAGSPRR